MGTELSLSFEWDRGIDESWRHVDRIPELVREGGRKTRQIKLRRADEEQNVIQIAS